MKELKVKMVDWYEGFNPENDGIIKLLKKKYNVVFSENPDYVIGSVYGETMSKNALKYDAVRVFWTGESVCPNFNFYDYAIGFDELTFGDRYFRMPLCCEVYDKRRSDLIKSKELFDLAELRTKDLFANFIYSNQFGHKYREKMFRLLGQYKEVSSAGGYLNNMGFRCDDKIDFQRRCKFSIAFENGMYNGYSSEKIIDAFAAHTIPIYWGNPRIGDDFDESSFINCHKYNSLEEVINEVKRLDSDDDAYIEMMRRNPLRYDFDQRKAEYEEFIFHIFDQSKEEAYRRNCSLFGTRLEKTEIKKIQCYPISHVYSNRITNAIKERCSRS